MYTFQDVKDKTKEGIRRETEEGLGIMAFFYYSNKGVPLEYFEDRLEEMYPTNAHKILAYFDFRNEHPELFEQEQSS